MAKSWPFTTLSSLSDNAQEAASIVSYGKVIVLQGPSSAGKSTLAKALQSSLDDYWWALEADDITRMQPIWRPEGAFWNPTIEERPHPSWDHDTRLARWLDGYFGCLATIAKSGSNVIAVGGWLQTSWLVQWADSLIGIDALCIGVYCPLEELERREIHRGDRGIGYARSHYDIVHTHAPYDVAVDSRAMTPEEMAARIRAALQAPPALPFFERIRRERPE